MRVVYLNQDRGIGPQRKKGAAVHVAAMQEAFRALGCEVVPLEEKDGARTAAALAELHAQEPIDLLYERYALGAATGGVFSRARGIPHLLEVNAPLLEEAAQHRGAAFDDEVPAREAALLAAADHVFAVSPGVADYVVRLGVPRARVHVHPNAVDAERFRPRSSGELRAELSIPADALVIGFHGRLRPWHGFERVAAAARALLERGHAVHVLTVGEGGFAEVLAEAGLAGHSTCLAWVPHAEVARLVASFDTLALGYGAGSGFYFSPLKLLEAMACGAVAVVPDLGDLPELVQQGAAGLVYPAGSVEGLAAALESLCVDAALRQRLAAGAVEVARGRSWVAVARAALELARAVRVGGGR